MTIADLTRFFGQSAELFRLGPRSLRYIVRCIHRPSPLRRCRECSQQHTDCDTPQMSSHGHRYVTAHPPSMCCLAQRGSCRSHKLAGTAGTRRNTNIAIQGPVLTSRLRSLATRPRGHCRLSRSAWPPLQIRIDCPESHGDKRNSSGCWGAPACDRRTCDESAC
jgi:hypothetical protein